MKHTKRLLSLLLSVMMCLFIIPALQAGATSKTTDEAIAWVKSKLGQGLDMDGAYGCQCVDLILAYYDFLGVARSSGNGADYAWNALPSGWQRLQGVHPQRGDILVYSGSDSNPYGHVAIYEADQVHYHQNFNGHAYVEKVTYMYNGLNNPYWGVIRPNWNNIHIHNYTSATVTSAPTRTTSGTRLWKCACGATKTQTIPAIPYKTVLKEGIYTIATKCKAGSYIAVNRDYNSDNVKIWDGAAADQHWLFHKNLDGTYSIENAFYRGYYLTIENYSMVNEGNLIVHQRTGGDNQKFYVIPEGSSYYRLVVKHSYMTIDLWNADPTNNTNIAQYEDNGTNAQRWAITLSNPSLSVSASSVTVAAGSSKTVNWTFGRAYEFTHSTTVSDSNVCSFNWGGWNDRTRVMNITGKAGGTATITVTFKDQNSDIVYDKKTITVTVTETTKPTVSISSTNNVAASQTVTLSMSDNAGLAGYYWGTSSSYSSNTYTSVSGTSKSVERTVSSAGTYYLTAKDTSGNVSSTVSKTFYKTTLNTNGGSVSPTSVLTVNGNSFTLPTPTRTGYTFKNWNTASDGNGTAYTGVFKPFGNFTLYAQWTKNAVEQYTLTYNANGGTCAPEQQTGNGTVTLSTVVPTRDGYAFLGWAESGSASKAQHAPGAPFTLTVNATLYAVWQKNETPDEPHLEPMIAIRNYAEIRTVDYRTSIVFSADKVENPVPGAQVHWFIDGQDKGATDTCIVRNAEKSFTVQAKYMKDGKTLAESKTETVNVKADFLARLKSFFRSLFGMLPVIAQEYLGAEVVDRIPS